MTNINLKHKLINSDADFIKRLRQIIPKRGNNFPEENLRELSDRELTRMLKNTTGFQQSLNELESKPRKIK